MTKTMGINQKDALVKLRKKFWAFRKKFFFIEGRRQRGINQKGALVKLRKIFEPFGGKNVRVPPLHIRINFGPFGGKNARVPAYALFWELLGGTCTPLYPP